MSVQFCYASTNALDGPGRDRLINRIEADVPGHRWWAESICLWATDDGVAGSTRLMMLSVEPEEDCVMAWVDAVHIAKLLQSYAREFGITWDLSFDGEIPMGRITGEDSDAATFKALNMLLDMGDVEPGDPTLPARIREIDAKYANRWE
jgi:hypothetical protein